ncbi:hypothetical protein DH86_00001893, partial [Scytalidium sp. 3C]
MGMMGIPIARRLAVSEARHALSLFAGLRNASPRGLRPCFQCSLESQSTNATSNGAPTTVIDGRTYQTDEWSNLSSNITSLVSRRLHLQKDHPIAITRSIIENLFPKPTYKYHNTHFPVVSTLQNFDSLGFPADHPGRNRTDTYYVNKNTVLRTHTSAHQADTFRANESEGYLISA